MSQCRSQFIKIDDNRWEIPCDYKSGMLVPGLIYANDAMLEIIANEQTPEQVANVACLPGIIGFSFGMPDIHLGYGFPIGGVAAMNVNKGVISPGGVGYDINCGVRLLCTNLFETEVRARINELLGELFTNVPSGLGSKGKIKLDRKQIDNVMIEGALWAVKHGFGSNLDLEVTEDNGYIKNANPDKVSDKAVKRGISQIGTLGSGNHFIEVQVVKEVFDSHAASAMGIVGVGQVLILIHTGSRGFGHQVCTDHLRIMESAVTRYGIKLPDRQLACAPIESPEGKDYFAAMSCAANYAWCNRQCITHWVRESFTKVFKKPSQELNIRQTYDVSHNIAKIENHIIDKKNMTVCVHRKGATRAFPPGHNDIPLCYREIGQPVFIPGDMGSCSFIAIGTQKAMDENFGSTCHGAGRLLSRSAARRKLNGKDVLKELRGRGISVKTEYVSSLAEEASQAYKDVTEVVNIVQQAGISYKVAMTIPLGVIKG